MSDAPDPSVTDSLPIDGVDYWRIYRHYTYYETPQTREFLESWEAFAKKHRAPLNKWWRKQLKAFRAADKTMECT